jgi:hypothetical protein
MPDLKKQLAEAFDDYMLRFGFQPIGEDRRGNLCWKVEDAIPLLEALRLTADSDYAQQQERTLH